MKAMGWVSVSTCLAVAAACSTSTAERSVADGAIGTSAARADAAADGAAAIVLSVDGGGVRPGALRLAVPAYFYPGPDWQRLVAAAPTVGMIIFNPQSGPGTAGDPQYTAAIGQARAAGIVVLGYVSTNYGQRAEADITADINQYYDFYAPSGIYLAEGPMDADCATLEAEYNRLTSAARARDPKAYLAIGTRFCPTYIQFTDLMVQYAEDWTGYQSYTPPSWMPANSPERFCTFVNSVPLGDASRALSLEIANGAGWVFATDGTTPNPWGALPSYFDQELAAIAR